MKARRHFCAFLLPSNIKLHSFWSFFVESSNSTLTQRHTKIENKIRLKPRTKVETYIGLAFLLAFSTQTNFNCLGFSEISYCYFLICSFFSLFYPLKLGSDSLHRIMRSTSIVSFQKTVLQVNFNIKYQNSVTTRVDTQKSLQKVSIFISLDHPPKISTPCLMKLWIFSLSIS